MSQERAATPWHLWLIGILALLWNAMGCFDYFMTKTKNEAYMASFTPEQLEFFYGFPSWMTAFWAIAVWGALLGAILLLLRKRLAAPVFLVSLIAAVITGIHNYGFANALELLGTVGAIFSVVIYAIGAALFVYARAMTKRNVLT